MTFETAPVRCILHPHGTPRISIVLFAPAALEVDQDFVRKGHRTFVPVSNWLNTLLHVP
jgi:hypothetical protein